MTHRIFRDHMGRIHIVRRTEEEILERLRYFAGCAVVTLLISAALVMASGILG